VPARAAGTKDGTTMGEKNWNAAEYSVQIVLMDSIKTIWSKY
jgi:hypothetical protein